MGGRREDLPKGWWKSSSKITVDKTPFHSNKYYAPKQIAETLGFKRDTVYGWIKSGELVAKKIDSDIRVLGANIQDFLNKKAGAERT